MTTLWNYTRSGILAGPVTSEELKRLVSVNKLTKTDWVCKVGTTKWVAALNVKGLFSSPPPVPIRSQQANQESIFQSPAKLSQPAISISSPPPLPPQPPQIKQSVLQNSPQILPQQTAPQNFRYQPTSTDPFKSERVSFLGNFIAGCIGVLVDFTLRSFDRFENLFSASPHNPNQAERQIQSTNRSLDYFRSSKKFNSKIKISSSYKIKSVRTSVLHSSKGTSGILLTTVLLFFIISLLLLVIVRILCNVGSLSLPWIQGFGNRFVYGIIPMEAVFLLGCAGGVLTVWIKAGFLNGVISQVLALVLISLATMGVNNSYPVLHDILFWRGQNREFKEEYVWVGSMRGLDLNPAIGTANGHKVWLHNNTEAQNPSWSQLMKFLNDDKTDALPYQEKVFVCADFAEMLHNNAEAAGWRCAYVTIDLTGYTSGHALNAFQTTDRGLVYIDSTGHHKDDGMNLISSDKEVNLKSGESYIPKPIFDEGFTYPSMGDASNILVTW